MRDTLLGDPATPVWVAAVLRDTRDADPVDVLNALDTLRAVVYAEHIELARAFGRYA